MLRLYFQRSSRTPPSTGWVWSITGLIASAAVLRYFSGPAAFSQPLLLSLSAACRTLAYLALAVKMLSLGRTL